MVTTALRASARRCLKAPLRPTILRRRASSRGGAHEERVMDHRLIPLCHRHVIRQLRPSELPRFREHLMRLDPHSRRDRFNGAIDDDFISPMRSAAFRRHRVIGYVEGNRRARRSCMARSGADRRNRLQRRAEWQHRASAARCSSARQCTRLVSRSSRHIANARCLAQSAHLHSRMTRSAITMPPRDVAATCWLAAGRYSETASRLCNTSGR